MSESEHTVAAPVCLVTGANRGLGFAVCRALARRQARVILTARETVKGADAAARLQAEGMHVDFQRLDVTEASTIDALRNHIEKTYGRLDVLINNAAIGAPGDRDILTVDIEVVQLALATNCYAPWRISQAFLSPLEKSGAGRIINVSSGAGALSTAGKGIAAYRLSKACLNAVTVFMAAELKDSNVSVNAACPGSMRTCMGRTDADQEPREAAESVVWLALDAPQELNGKFLRHGKVIPW